MTFNDKIEKLDSELRQLRKELESDLAKYRDSGYLIRRER
jgi:hypothetical protein